MRLTKESQYAILLSLYIARAGRANIETAAANLGLSESFLYQVARNLRKGNILNSIRGPGGGYELVNSIRLLDVLSSIDGNGLLSQTERLKYATGVPEERALELIVSNMGLAMWPLLNKPIKTIMAELSSKETSILNLISSKSLEQ